jgi:hypothetical protein
MAERFDKNLPVKLTDKELRDYGDELAKKDREYRESEMNKKLIAKQLQNDLDEIDAVRKSLATKIEQRQEYRMVECEEVKDAETGTVIHTRLDTGAEVYRRAMNQEEREKAKQKNMFESSEPIDISEFEDS